MTFVVNKVAELVLRQSKRHSPMRLVQLFVFASQFEMLGWPLAWFFVHRKLVLPASALEMSMTGCSLLADQGLMVNCCPMWPKMSWCPIPLACSES